MEKRYVMAMDEGMSACGIETFSPNREALLGEPEFGDDGGSGALVAIEVRWISGITAIFMDRLRCAVLPRRV